MTKVRLSDRAMPMKYSRDQLSGSTWLLNESPPRQLVGGISGWTSEAGPGVLEIGVFKDSQLLQMEDLKDRIWIRLSEKLGLQLGGLLLRVVAQNRELRRRAGNPNDAIVEVTKFDPIHFARNEPDGDFLGSLEISKAGGDALLEDAQDQWNLLLAEPVSESLALCILDSLGRLSIDAYLAKKPQSK